MYQWHWVNEWQMKKWMNENMNFHFTSPVSINSLILNKGLQVQWLWKHVGFCARIADESNIQSNKGTPHDFYVCFQEFGKSGYNLLFNDLMMG